MKIVDSLRNKLEGLIRATNRYPLTMLFLLAIAVVNAITINSDFEDYSTYLFTFIVGALLSAVSQQMYERFFTKPSERIALMAGAIVVTILYYFTIGSTTIFSMENGIKTAVIVFALFMTFIWVPSIKNQITFNESFLAAFKACFTTILFSAVLAGGISLIITAIDILLIDVDYKTIPHALNLIASLFAPTFFLSFTPTYPSKNDVGMSNEELALRKQNVQKATSCPKILDILLSYIIIPLTVVYTIILIAYVILNIQGDFWTKNLLEPLLVSYAITVILVYILVSNLENKFTTLFRKIFPKVLVPIVLFQTIASSLKIGDMGITHGRYYVIMFGIFAFISGLIFSILRPKKNGLIVAVLLVFSVISIIPPVDAFTVSRVNQVNLLKATLEKNDMLENNTIVPNGKIPIEDKQIITKTVSYLAQMDYTKKVDWLPENILFFNNFKQTFGFNETYDFTDPSDGIGPQHNYAYFNLEDHVVVNIEGHDFMTQMYVDSTQVGVNGKAISFKKDNHRYLVKQKREDKNIIIQLLDENDKELIRYNVRELFESLLGDNETKDQLTIDEATFIQENDQAKLTILVRSVNVHGSQYNGEFFVFLKIK